MMPFRPLRLAADTMRDQCRWLCIPTRGLQQGTTAPPTRMATNDQ